MNKTTPDPETPIFGELNKELGELPEIDVHDFDSHGFEFPVTGEKAADHEAAEESEQPVSAPAESESAETAANSGGGRRRKDD